MEQPEISDLIVSYDAATLARQPVRQGDVVRIFEDAGNRRAARIVAEMPATDGVLDPDAVDRRLIRAHCEIQRISEEFQHGRRVAELLRPVLATLREAKVPPPLRVVDVGCGTGFVLRWLARYADLGEGIVLVGADYNHALVAEAQRLAAVEGLAVEFHGANAFQLAEPATVLLTTGVIHHFRGPDLLAFLRQHDRPETQAFAHFDFQPSRLAPFGAWLFHAARMRDPLSKHDGVLSAVRAHSGKTLVQAARSGAPSFVSGMFGERLFFLPMPRSMHTLVGIRPAQMAAFVRHLGPRARRLGLLV